MIDLYNLDGYGYSIQLIGFKIGIRSFRGSSYKPILCTSSNQASPVKPEWPETVRSPKHSRPMKRAAVSAIMVCMLQACPGSSMIYLLGPCIHMPDSSTSQHSTMFICVRFQCSEELIKHAHASHMLPALHMNKAG